MDDNELPTAPTTTVVAPIQKVHIDGHTVLKIVHYCDSNAHQAGWLLGLDDAANGIVNVTLPLPWFKCEKKSGDDLIGDDVGGDDAGGNNATESNNYREKNNMIDAVLTNSIIDCMNAAMLIEDLNVGFFTAERIMDPVVVSKFEFSYSNNPNSIMIVYDAKQSRLGGSLILKAYRFSEKYIQNKILKTSKIFIKSDDVFEEIPLIISNKGHLSALVRTCAEVYYEDICNKSRLLDMTGGEEVLQKHLDEIDRTVDKITEDQQDILRYTKSISDGRLKRINWLNSRYKENIELKKDGDDPLSMSLKDSEFGNLPDVKDSELYTIASMNIGHLNSTTEDLNSHINMNFQKLFITKQLYNNTGEKINNE